MALRLLDYAQPAHSDERLRAGDKAILHIGDHPVTINESHAFTLGLIGLIVDEESIVVRTVLHEPHYFVGGFALAYLIGRILRR